MFSAATLHAEGWSLTSWIPGQKDKPSTSKTSSTRTPLLDGKPLRSTSKSRAARQPSVWGRMTTGTKNFFARTKDALTWDSEPEPRSGGTHTSWDDPAPRLSRKKEEGSSFWNWFGPEEPRPSKTVQGFLSQKRPEDQYQ
jgi:hypothetical protein